MTGMMALPRTPMDTLPADSETEKDAEDTVDMTALPPGQLQGEFYVQQIGLMTIAFPKVVLTECT